MEPTCARETRLLTLRPMRVWVFSILAAAVSCTQATGGYDTGIAIANTTWDPGTTAMGVTGAVKQSGSITFYFYPQAPGTTPVTYTTHAGSPGAGLDASGNLPSGSTYVALLSKILADAGVTADFGGYIVVITNFTNAHCLFVLSNFTTFSQGALGLVIYEPRAGGGEALEH